MSRPTLEAVLNYAISDRTLFHHPDDYRRNALIHQSGLWAAQGIDFIQLREKDLEAGQLADLTRAMLVAVRTVAGTGTRLLVNSRADVAVAAGADGVHLTAAAGELTPDQVRAVFAAAGRPIPVVSVACHTVSDVMQACRGGADLMLFGPVYGKVVGGIEVMAGVGVGSLRAACVAADGVRLLALGGVTRENASECMAAGAAGVAGIRLFLEDPGSVVDESSDRE